MQQLVANDNDNNRKNKNNSSSSSNDHNSMPPQAQVMSETTAMQEIHQPFNHLSHLKQMHQNWGEDQTQNDGLQIRNRLEESSAVSDAAKMAPITHNVNRQPSPTNISVGSCKSNNSSRPASKGSRSSSASSLPRSSGVMSPMNAGMTGNATFNKPFAGVKRGSGVDIKGPTPEVAQQLRFPWKLHLLLERCEYEHQQKLAAAAAEGTSANRVPDMPISWLPSGKAFKVHDKERFVKEVMPSFFGTQSFKTFQRNLNLW